VQALGDRPGDAAFVGDSEDDYGTALEVSGHEFSLEEKEYQRRQWIGVVEWYILLVEVNMTKQEQKMLNIKDPEAHYWAQRLAKMTGQNMTEIVVGALQERFKREIEKYKGPLSDRLLEIGKDCAHHLKEPFRSIDHADLLYDEKGLPR
jgi:antitoxin VapB